MIVLKKEKIESFVVTHVSVGFVRETSLRLSNMV